PPRSVKSSGRSRPQSQLTIGSERTCTECGQTKPLSGSLSIESTKRGYYGRCRACRNARARARRGAGQVLQVEAAASTIPGERTCKECGETKPLSGFLRVKDTKSGYNGRCRLCRNAAVRARYHSNEPARLAEIERS